MRLGSFLRDGRPAYGLVSEAGVIDLSSRFGERAPDLKSLLAGDLDEVRDLVGEPADLELDQVEWQPPIPNPSQILCVGLNYRDHASEVGRPVEEQPTIFLRVAQSQAAHRHPIIRPKASSQLDFEGELALVVGRPGRHISPESALEHVAGYAPYNDATLRDWQRHSAQYTAGKNFPSTGGFGPWIVTADEVPDPTSLEVVTRLNGETVQRGSLGELIFSIPDVLAYVSTFTELRSGDVVLTGTPAGVGSKREPQLWMRPGDLVEVEVPGVATLVNPVVDEADWESSAQPSGAAGQNS